MTTLKKLEIKENGQYRNIDLRDLDPDEHIFLTKEEYNEGLEKTGQYGAYYIVTALYGDDKVSFFLNAPAHEQWASTGGLGDTLKLSKYAEKIKFKSGSRLVEKISIELANKEETVAEPVKEDLLS